MKLPSLLAACAVPALCLQGAWREGLLGLVEDSAAPYHYSLEHGWLYAPAGLDETEGFWWYAFAYGLGWQHRQPQTGGWDYAPRVEGWIYPGGAEAPGWWFNRGEWRRTPESRNWFVATTGDDAGVGTLEAPFATIAKAISVAGPNDVIRVRGGVYREQLLPGVSGEPYFPVTLEAYAPPGGEPEEVVVSAYVPLVPGQDGLGQWVAEGDGIYRIQLTAGFGTVPNRLLVRLDGVDGVDARWPDADTSFAFFRRDRASADSVTVVEESGQQKTVRYHHAGLAGYPADAWRGARMIYLPGKGWTDGVTTVTASGNGYVQYTYTEATFGGGWNAASAGDTFFLLGRKAAINRPGEFFHDVAGLDGPNGMLYVKFPDGKGPDNTRVEVKRHTFGFRVAGRSHWRVRNIRFDGGAVAATATARDIHFENISVEGVYAMGGTTYDGAVSLAGEGMVLRDSRVYQSSVAGVAVSAPGALIANNVIGWTAGPGIHTLAGSRNLLVRNNTVYLSGGQNIGITARGSRYFSNRAYLAGMTVTDIAALNAWGSGDMGGMEIAWNMVHDNVAVLDRNRPLVWNGGMGIRFDSGGGAGVSNGVVHHNMVWNTTWDGINMWGLEAGQVNYGNAQISVYNNSVGGVLASAGNGVNVTGVSFVRNYSDAFVPRHSNTSTVLELLDNFTRLPGGHPGASGDPRLFNAAAFDFRPLPDSPLLADPPRGAIGPGEVFPVAGALWTAPDPARLSARFIETVGGLSAIGVSGMPPGLHLPDGALLRVAGSHLTNDLLHRYDIANHAAEAVFLVDFIESAEPVMVEISLDGGLTYAALNPVTIGGGVVIEPVTVLADLNWSGRLNTANNDAGGPLSNLRKTDASNPNLQVGDNANNAELALVLVFNMAEVAAALDAVQSWVLVIEAKGKGLAPNPFPGAVDVRVSPLTGPLASNADLYARVNDGAALLTAATLPAGFDINGTYTIDLADIAGQTGLARDAAHLLVLLRAADPRAPSFSNGAAEQTFFSIVTARMDVTLASIPE